MLRCGRKLQEELHLPKAELQQMKDNSSRCIGVLELIKAASSMQGFYSPPHSLHCAVLAVTCLALPRKLEKRMERDFELVCRFLEAVFVEWVLFQTPVAKFFSFRLHITKLEKMGDWYRGERKRERVW